MSDWNTLHLFDSKRFYRSIVPDLKSRGQIIGTYLRSKLYWYLTRIDEIDDELIGRLKAFIRGFDDTFRVHTEFYRIEHVKKGKDESYEDFLRKKQSRITAFQNKYNTEIYHYTNVLPLILFSECAQFNPHLILGRRIFTSHISTLKGSIAEECCANIMAVRTGAIVHYDIGFISNWLTHEEVKLLWFDLVNISPKTDDSIQYFNDFKNFLQVAFENELGLLSISNVREDVLKLIEPPGLDIDIDLKQGNFVNVIESK